MLEKKRNLINIRKEKKWKIMQIKSKSQINREQNGENTFGKKYRYSEQQINRTTSQQFNRDLNFSGNKT